MNTLERELLERCKVMADNAADNAYELFNDYKRAYGDKYRPERLEAYRKEAEDAIKIGNDIEACLVKPVQEPAAWLTVHGAVKEAISQCKDATGMGNKIDTYVNANQITHDAVDESNSTTPQSRGYEKAEAALLSDQLRLFETTCMSEKDDAPSHPYLFKCNRKMKP
jgi:hypothetical protein